MKAGSSVTIRDVAAAAGVSHGTVSNVLNRSSSVSPETRKRVLQAIDDLGFVRNAGAAMMRGGRSRSIGLVVLDAANPYFAEVAAGVEAAARDHNQLVILCNSGEDQAQQQRYLEVLEEQRVQGVLISPVDADMSGLEWLRERGTAVVLLEEARPGYCSVRTDDTLGGDLAAQHLIDHGHRELLFASPARTVRQYEERFAGARRAVRRSGLPAAALRTLEIGTHGTAREGFTAGQEFLAGGSGATGVVCGNDLYALGLIAALLQAGVDVPGRVSVVGYDDIDLAEHSALPLTTIAQPKYSMGHTAAELLLSEAEQGPQHKHQHVVFVPELKVRESTGPAPGSGS